MTRGWRFGVALALGAGLNALIVTALALEVTPTSAPTSAIARVTMRLPDGGLMDVLTETTARWGTEAVDVRWFVVVWDDDQDHADVESDGTLPIDWGGDAVEVAPWMARALRTRIDPRLAQRPDNVFDSSSTTLIAHGWPWRSAWYVMHSVRAEVVDVDGAWTWPSPRAGAAPTRLPLKVRWPGTLANTLLFASVLRLGAHAFGVARRAVRRRGDRCAACGYRLAGAVRCAECGTIRRTGDRVD